MESVGPVFSHAGREAEAWARCITHVSQACPWLWSAGDVMKFMEHQDLAGPARTLFASGVNDEDLMFMTTETLTDGLRLNSFAAAKVLAARDARVHGP